MRVSGQEQRAASNLSRSFETRVLVCKWKPSNELYYFAWKRALSKSKSSPARIIRVDFSLPPPPPARCLSILRVARATTLAHLSSGSYGTILGTAGLPRLRAENKSPARRRGWRRGSFSASGFLGSATLLLSWFFLRSPARKGNRDTTGGGGGGGRRAGTPDPHFRFK